VFTVEGCYGEVHQSIHANRWRQQKKTLEYQDTIDMIYELIQKYQPSHYIIIGGDLNEDLTNSVQDNRKQYLIEFIDECNLK
jgi:nicotinic acid mononucleotide adenylyltransferase